MSLISQEFIEFGDLTEDYESGTVQTFNVQAKCRFYDKKAVNFTGDDEFLDYDSIAVVKTYNPTSKNLARYKNDVYRVVQVSALQGRISKNKYQVKLKLYE